MKVFGHVHRVVDIGGRVLSLRYVPVIIENVLAGGVHQLLHSLRRELELIAGREAGVPPRIATFYVGLDRLVRFLLNVDRTVDLLQEALLLFMLSDHLMVRSASER